jgi:hypothetical protein
MKELFEFEGKRNCALTIFIPNNSFTKCMKIIENKIYSIKHGNKKKQLIGIINKIKKETVIIQNYNNYNGMIVCCGLDNKLDIKYYQLKPIKTIIQFEYFYDYNFYVNKIIEKMYKNVEFVETKEFQTWINKIDKFKNNQLLIYETEINDYIDTNSISNFFYFSNDALDICYLNNIEKYNFNFILFSLNDILLTDLQKQYGKILCSLHYTPLYI